MSHGLLLQFCLLLVICRQVIYLTAKYNGKDDDDDNDDEGDNNYSQGFYDT